MRIVKPRALQRGDVIGICAPASPPDSEEQLHRGISYLEKLGYRVEMGNNVHRRRGYLAGTDEQRAADVNALFAKKSVKAIFTVRGGYGAHRILPFLNYNLIKHNPKILVGYSDITALQMAIFRKSGLITFSGPMVASEMAGGLRGTAEEEFWQCLTSTLPPGPLQCKTDPHFATGRRKTSEGRLIGGNLSLVASLSGTPYFPEPKGSILLLEEIDERPYRIDRTLQQLRHAGVLEKVKGVVFGKFIGCTAEAGKSSLTLHQVIGDTFKEMSYPLLSGLRYGHLTNSFTIPIGIRVRLHAASKKLEFLEAGVS